MGNRKQPKKIESNYRGVFPKIKQNSKTKNQGNEEQNKKNDTNGTRKKIIKEGAYKFTTEPENQKKTEGNTGKINKEKDEQNKKNNTNGTRKRLLKRGFTHT